VRRSGVILYALQAAAAQLHLAAGIAADGASESSRGVSVFDA